MKKILCIALALALLALAGCGSKPTSQPEPAPESSSQTAPESKAVPPSTPEPEPEPGPEPEPEPEPGPESEPGPVPQSSEAPAPEDEAVPQDPAGEEGDEEEDGEDEEEEENEVDELGAPAVPHGEELAGLDLSAMTAAQIKPMLDKVLARADYFCQYGRTGEFDEAGMDTRKESAIQRPYRDHSSWTFYPYTNLPYHTVDELKEGMQTAFLWDVLNTDLHYLFESMTDDGERLYFADGVTGYSKSHHWDTANMTVVEASAGKVTLEMPVTWRDDTFTADLNLELVDGYLVLDSTYFAIPEEQRANHHH